MRIIPIFIASLMLVSCADDIEAAVPPSASPPSVSISGTLPVMHIETENRQPITSKTEYLNATYWLDPVGNDAIEPLGSESVPIGYADTRTGTLVMERREKPYKIKFAKKTAVMGMSKNKHFALLKPTENTVAGLNLGKLMDMAWTPDFRPVEVVLNGDYIGTVFPDRDNTHR